jgi:hypothetical protein
MLVSAEVLMTVLIVFGVGFLGGFIFTVTDDTLKSVIRVQEIVFGHMLRKCLFVGLFTGIFAAGLFPTFSTFAPDGSVKIQTVIAPAFYTAILTPIIANSLELLISNLFVKR